MSDYKEIFGREPEPWREPLGALRLTLAEGAENEWTIERARDECEWLTRVLNEDSEYRVLITGSREWDDPALMREALKEARNRANGRPMVLICGGARGADQMAEKLGGLSDNCRIELYPADWNTHGKVAGFIRNQEMVDSTADICLAFKVRGAGNRGTSDCIERAEKAGIEVVEWWNE